VFDLHDIITRIDNIRAAALRQNHVSVKKNLKEFDKKYKMNDLPLFFLYERLFFGAGVSVSPTEKGNSLREIESVLKLFEKHPRQKFSLLLKAGQLESSINKKKISPRYFSQALGLAESLQDKQLMADAYMNIGQMFASRYPGLGLYFYRRAEIKSAENDDGNFASKIRLERAFLTVICWRLWKDEKQREDLLIEANKIIDTDSYLPPNESEANRADYIHAFVKQDHEAIARLLNKMKATASPLIICELEEHYIGLCIEAGLFDKAEDMLSTYRKDATSLKGASDTIHKYIETVELHINNKFAERYTPSYILRKKYEPTTLFDILDKYAMADEMWALDTSEIRYLFPFHAQEGFFEPVIMPDNTATLFPMGLAFNVYYRGQASSFSPSKPSLYRKGMTEAKQFIERIRFEELKRLLEDYPLTKLFREDFYALAPDGKHHLLPLSIDTLALAQHYGIKTELMDLTTDKFVAAFFATTDCKDDRYTPIVDKRKEKGVFYRYVHIDFPMSGKSRLRAVGLQPLSRPGEQRGLVYEMSPDDDFNNIVTTTEEFEHDKDVSEFIFNYTNRSRKLFPINPIQNHIERICKSKTLSRQACEMARKEFYPEITDEMLDSYLEQEGVVLSENISFGFTQEEKDGIIASWKNGEAKIIARQILPRWSMNP
jgi:hypothetical protein